ncbi:NAD(P)H-dependent FMN reductase [Rhodococcus sp. 27YEA15]|uniref:NADPH-dependent FMN reductase n=1 Tax=Rhodococcus sp. 27YEA15 TaxID=3156259 RepID=UPI003C79EA42
MFNETLHTTVIIGSTREGRFAPTVATWFTDVATSHGGMTIDIVDPAEIELPVVHPAFGTVATSELAALGERLSASDAFVVVTPEYNHSFPAVLKHTIDLFRDEWKAKPVGFVSYGGQGGGLRAVEHLRLVFAELHAVTVRDSVSFHGAARIFGDDGMPIESAVCDGAAKNMLDQLYWWGTTLRAARAENPYRA